MHVHDIFSPKNYLKPSLVDEVKFWNEHYLLGAFLTHNRAWTIVGALNFLHHHYYERLKGAAPFLSPEREPGSSYIQKIAWTSLVLTGRCLHLELLPFDSVRVIIRSEEKITVGTSIRESYEFYRDC